MEQLKQILRLQPYDFSVNAIECHAGISWPTVKKYLARIKGAAIDDNDLAGARQIKLWFAFKLSFSLALIYHAEVQAQHNIL